MNESRRKSSVGVTDAGKTVIRGTFFVALAALVVPAFGVLAALVSVLLVSLVVGYFVRPRIRISGALPERIIAGETTSLNFVLKNIARLPAYNLNIQLEGLSEKIEQVGGPELVPHLRPGETIEVNISIKPRRRGLYQINGLVCRSGFPFNLFSFSTKNEQQDSFVVLPVFHRLHMPLRQLGRYVSSGGTRYAGIAGAFPEYAGNRPFVIGDSLRNIDSRAWARLAAPATKEYHDDFDNHAALVLDTKVPKTLKQTTSGDFTEFEAAVSLCASAAFTLNRECLIDFLAAGSDIHMFERQSRTIRLNKIHEILAGVEPEQTKGPEESPALIERFYEVSEVIFVLLEWNEFYEQLVEKAGVIGCHTTVLIIDGSEQTNERPNVSNRFGNVTFLSPNEVLSGQVRQL